MDSVESLSADELEVEIAKTRLLIAAERAAPGRLLRQEVKASPLGAVATAALAGTVLAVLGSGRRGGRPSFGNSLSGLLGPLLAGFAMTSEDD